MVTCVQRGTGPGTKMVIDSMPTPLCSLLSASPVAGKDHVTRSGQGGERRPWKALRAEPGTVNPRSILGVIIFIIITNFNKTFPSLSSLPPFPLQ